MEPDMLLELAAQVDRETPDYTEVDQAIESLSDPWGTLKGLVKRVHIDFL